MIRNQQIAIERQENRDYSISWTKEFSPGAVEIYVGNSPADAAQGKRVAVGESGSARIENLREPVRHFFHLIPENGEGVTYTERAISIPGGTNLRDVGGYLTSDGRQVQWGKIFRSGHLAIAEGDDKDYLASLGLTVNCDFRHARDFVEVPNTLPAGVDAINVPVDAGSFATFLQNISADQLNETSMIAAMCDVNRQLVTKYQDEYRQMFSALLSMDDGAFLVNCSAGKDRTGFAVALILYTLGVPHETILHDYLLSSRYFKIPEPKASDAAAYAKKYSPEVMQILKSGVTKPLREVREEYLRVALDAMTEMSGSIENHLEKVYGVGETERSLLRERFTV